MYRLLLISFILITENLSFSQEPFNQHITAIDGTAYVDITSFKKIESDFATRRFEIIKGSLHINVSGIIDRFSEPKIIISLFAKETINNELVIHSGRDSQYIQYKVEGFGSGIYAGQYTNDGYFRIITRFKIIAPGHPSYFLDIPLNIHILPDGKLPSNMCYIAGTGYLHNYTERKKKNKKRQAVVPDSSEKDLHFILPKKNDNDKE